MLKTLSERKFDEGIRSGEAPFGESGLPRAAGILRVPGGAGVRSREATGGRGRGSRFATADACAGAPDPRRGGPLRGGTRGGTGQGGSRGGRPRRGRGPLRNPGEGPLPSLLPEGGGQQIFAGDPTGAAETRGAVPPFPERAGGPAVPPPGDAAVRAGRRRGRSHPFRSPLPHGISPEEGDRGGRGRGRASPRGRKEFARAGELYEGVAGSSPKSETAPRFLFHAARLAEAHGPPEAAERRFSVYRARYPYPAWMWTYATLSVGLSAGARGDSKTLDPTVRGRSAESGCRHG